MNRAPIASSLIKSVGHEGEAMEVELASGQIYRYDGISQAQFDAFMASDSKGHHFNHHIKGACTACTRVERERAD